MVSGRREPVFSGDVKNSELMAFLQVGRKCRNANGFSRELVQSSAFLRGEKKTNEYLLYTRIFNDRLSSFLDKSEQKKMSVDHIFAYGATMNRSETRSWLEANGYDSSLVKNVYPAKLSGYDFVWNFYSTGRGSGLANIERKEGAVVYGIVLEIDSSLLKAFDRKEGHPTFFSRGANRISVERIPDGGSIQAWVYIASGNRQGRRDILPSREYKKVVLDAVLFWELPQEFMDKVRDWETT